MSKNPPVLICSDDNAENAWRAVFHDCQDGLRGFLTNRLRQEADVDDCLQSVFVKMIRQARRTDSSVAVVARRAWLFRVAANEAARLWRSRAAAERLIQHQGQQWHNGDAAIGDTAEKIILTESTLQLRQVIEQLPEHYRVIVQMRTAQEMTFQEIADQLQIPIGTALTRMRRALERIRDQMPD